MKKFSNDEIKFRVANAIFDVRKGLLKSNSMVISLAVDQIGVVTFQNTDLVMLNKTAKCLKEAMITNLKLLPLFSTDESTTGVIAAFIMNELYNLSCTDSKIGELTYYIEANKMIWIIANNYPSSTAQPVVNQTKIALKTYAPGFLESSSSCSLIIPSSDSKVYEDEFLVRLRIPKSNFESYSGKS